MVLSYSFRTEAPGNRAHCLSGSLQYPQHLRQCQTQSWHLFQEQRNAQLGKRIHLPGQLWDSLGGLSPGWGTMLMSRLLPPQPLAEANLCGLQVATLLTLRGRGSLPTPALATFKFACAGPKLLSPALATTCARRRERVTVLGKLSRVTQKRGIIFTEER